MGKLFNDVPVTTYTKVPLSFEETKKELLRHRPKELIFKPYSQSKPCLSIYKMTEDEVIYRWVNSINPEFKTVSWEEFYKQIKNYLTDIEFEDFKCLEKHVYSRSVGCFIQCKECREDPKNNT